MKEKLSIEEVVAADGSGKVLPNANGCLDGFVYVAKREELCRKARLKPWLFAVFLLTAGVCMTLQKAEAQAPLARHFWLNQESVNYTLSPPTSKGQWILAAARTERQATGVGQKNTIAVFRLDYKYAILRNESPELEDPCSEDVSVIGIPLYNEEDLEAGQEQVFNPYMDFTVHCVVEVDDSVERYVLCGSVRNTAQGASAKSIGIVAVLDEHLKLISLHAYDTVKMFYSVYAKGSFYYACGQMQNGKGIVLQDSLLGLSPWWGISAWVTNYPWVFHKIVPNNTSNPNLPEVSVSGANDTAIGWNVFQTTWGSFTHWSGQSFKPPYAIDTLSKVTLAYYPPVSSNSNLTGLLLSASSGPTATGRQVLHTYQFNYNKSPIMNHAFYIDWRGRLEDMDCDGDDSSRYGVAWVGNKPGTADIPQPTADYIHTDISFPPATPNSAYVIPFTPYYSNNDKSAWYSLHKVHYFPKTLPNGNNEFHAGGYYHNYFYTSDHPLNRTTFVVTPDLVIQDIGEKAPCAEKIELTITDITPFNTTSFSMQRIYIEGEDIEKFTQRYGFCTMDCEGNRDEDCGNKLLNKKK